MKSLFVFGLLLSRISFATDCSVDVMGLLMDANTTNAILESRGYQVSYSNPTYHIRGANYLGLEGEEIKMISMSERGKNNLLAFVEESGSFLKSFKRIEKTFLKSLPVCTK